MPTSGERKALWFLALVALSGTVVRLSRPERVAPSPAMDAQLRRVDSARAVRQVGRARPGSSRPPAPRTPRVPAPSPAAAGPLDLDRATMEELEALPGIGPALAARIAAHRDSAGAFGRVEALCDVRGVGPALVERLRPLVTFSGPPRPVSSACGEGSKTSRKTRGARHQK